MTKKFTEEQYQKIVEIGDQYHDDRLKKTEVLLDYMYDDFGFNGGEDTEPLDQALALANPLTRDLVKKDLVEVEQKFLFTKIKEVHGEILSLNQLEDDTMIYLDIDDPTPLTIKQAEEYGYNSDAFTKTPYEHGVFTVHISEEDDLPF